MSAITIAVAYMHIRRAPQIQRRNTIWNSLRHEGELPHMKSMVGSLAAAIGLLQRRRYEDVELTLNANREHDWPEPIRLIAAAVFLHAHFSLGDRPSVIKLIANEETKNDIDQPFLPIVAALENYAWADFKGVDRPLATPIALHMLWSKTQAGLTGSLLRFATSAFLRNCDVDRPSKLFDRANEYSQNQLVYFLRKVCVPNILDVSRVLKSTREVLEERQAVCASLRLLDPANAEEYETEVLMTANQLALDEGKLIVDRTRIHVDTLGLNRWATNTLSEDFARYIDLLSVQVGPEQHFDDVLKELLTSPGPRQSFVPENEADAVLFSMVRRLGDEFLTSSSFGLDFYLSKRVRHQSFIGLIRGPLEFSNLITTRESETSDYRRNEFWLKKFKTSSIETKDLLNDALTEFAGRFDELLLDAKNTRLHIRSTETPAGVVFLELSSQLMALTRSIVRTDADFSAFFITAVAVLWAALEPSLAEARIFITGELTPRITDAFDKLRAAARMIAESDVAFLELDAEIGTKSTEVQRALEDAATWFTHSNLEAGKRFFTLEQSVNIGIDAALKCQRAFEPVISKNVDASTNLEVSASNLIFVHDVLFVALDNVRAHSGLKKPYRDKRHAQFQQRYTDNRDPKRCQTS
jgi:hypothetical protein